MSITFKIGCNILATRMPKIFTFGLGLVFGFIVVFSVHLSFDYATKLKLNPMLNINKPLEIMYTSVAPKNGQENANSNENRGSFLVPNGEVADVKVSRMKMENKHADVKVSTMKMENKYCNIFFGKWVKDDSYPYYPAGSCPHIDVSFNCFRNKRPDEEYQQWRWQPNDCDIPRLNASRMLGMLRDKRLAFVGDSLNRNMWESLVCILRRAVQNKERVYKISGRQDFKKGLYAFRFEDYNCSVEFVMAPFLVQEWERDGVNGSTSTLRLDVMDSFAAKCKEAHVLVFNTGHWWNHDKTSQGKNYYQEGDYVYPQLNMLKAFEKALKTWGHWVDDNIDPNKTKVFFRGYSATHFSGGQWNSGGQCHKETQPFINETYLIKYPAMMNVLESVITRGEMKTPITYLNITTITDYRKDGHPSIYTRINRDISQEERLAQHKIQDCSHWCLPGVPDTWNELLYAFLTGSN